MMACFSAGSAFTVTSLSRAPVVSSSLMGSRTPMSTATASATRLLILSCEKRDFYGPLLGFWVLSKFEALKLKVVFMGEELEEQIPSTIPRAYTLTHCDFTANLTLAVSNRTHSKKLDWQTTLHRDDVVAEWKKIKEEMSLHVHCYVSGSDILQDLVAGFRYHIFSKELPLVLKAVVHGDSLLFRKHPELLEAKIEEVQLSKCWGPLEDATQYEMCKTEQALIT
ncbi:Senescence-inducible chloroplast stay-green protein [Musa troglodytarum]|uniref:Senescence-inducible chloroplast stay-green protein n=1 Tax=Musa troglodytarum TaxID=320322 RepID=A0A9E7E7D6_9LILI|nr:Senescence-inducible chloroplast stay-green protein [Musa troglodytarum]